LLRAICSRIQLAEFEQSTVCNLYEMKETKRKSSGVVGSTSDAVLVVRRSCGLNVERSVGSAKALASTDAALEKLKTVVRGSLSQGLRYLCSIPQLKAMVKLRATKWCARAPSDRGNPVVGAERVRAHH
jgi:hypothetical protein